MRAFIYVRVSTEEQAIKGWSIEEQKVLLLDMAEKEGYEVVGMFADPGKSAKSIEGRPGMKSMIHAVENGEADIVLAWTISRICRNLKELLILIDLFEEHNTKIKFLSDDIDTSTPAGRMHLQIAGSFSEYERNVIANNVFMGMAARAKDGHKNGGPAPFGYEWVLDETAPRKSSVLQIKEEEAEIVKSVFDAFISGKGYKTIANTLNLEGKRTQKGKFFSIGTIRGILINPVYCGRIVWGKYKGWDKNRRKGVNENPIVAKGVHAPIISEEIFDSAQALMSLRGGKRTKKYNDLNVLSGILRCPVCGAGMVLSRAPLKDGTKRAYYSCGAWKNKGRAVCSSNSIRLDKANDYVFKRLEELLDNKNLIKRLVTQINRAYKMEVEPAKLEIKMLDDKLQTIESKKKRLLSLLEDDDITIEEFRARKSELQTEEDCAIERKRECEEIIYTSKSGDVTYQEIQEVLKRIAPLLKSGDAEQINLLLHLMIERIDISAETREIESIQIKLDSRLQQYLNNVEDVPEGASSFYIYTRNSDIRFAI